MACRRKFPVKFNLIINCSNQAMHRMPVSTILVSSELDHSSVSVPKSSKSEVREFRKKAIRQSRFETQFRGKTGQLPSFIFPIEVRYVMFIVHM